jgi:hypothetical protein
MTVDQLFHDMTRIMHQHGVNCDASARTLAVTDKTVTDICDPDEPVSRAIIDAIWPTQKEIVAYHYTSADGAASILHTGVLRLYALRKRFDEREIVDFCKAHRLQGYLDRDCNGEPAYKDLNMANMFYASFTPDPVPDATDDYLWNAFTKKTGVRFKLRLRATNPNLRLVHYPPRDDQPIALLAELQECARRFGKEFVLAGISRLCAFYLHAGLKIEQEVRMLYRKWPGFGPAIENDGTHDYISVPLATGSSTGYQIDIVELQSDNSRFHSSGVPIVPRTP